MTATTITLRNSFHGTEFATTKSEEQILRIYDQIGQGTLSPANRQWVAKVRKTLCGIKGCTCGDELKVRA